MLLVDETLTLSFNWLLLKNILITREYIDRARRVMI